MTAAALVRRIYELEDALRAVLDAEGEVECRCHETEGVGNEMGHFGSCERCDLHMRARKTLEAPDER